MPARSPIALRSLAAICIPFLMPSGARGDRLFLIAGQSNAVGQGDSAARVVCLPNTASEYDIVADALKPLVDPAGQPWGLLEAAKPDGGSLAPAFAKRLSALTHERIVIVMAARGGSSCARQGQLGGYGTWDSTATASPANLVFGDAREKSERAMAKTGLPLSGILWLQGERDANAIKAGTETPAEYQAALIGVIRRFRRHFGTGLPFFIVKTGYQYQEAHPLLLDDTAGNVAVRRAQDAVAAAGSGVHIAYASTHLFGARNPSWMKDFVHYNQAGLNDIGDSAAQRVFAVLGKPEALLSQGMGRDASATGADASARPNAAGSGPHWQAFVFGRRSARRADGRLLRAD